MLKKSIPFSLLKRTLRSAALVVYLLVFAEFFLRWFAPVPVMPRYVTGAPYGVRMNIPNADYWQTTSDSRVHFHINSQGMRADHDYATRKPAGACRVLMLGDSFFMGYEVRLQDSLQYLIEQKLRADGFPCEVLNLAVSGEGPAENLITFRAVGKQYSPDIVLLELHRTNLDNNLRSGLFRLDHGALARGNATYLPGVRVSDWLMQWPAYRWVGEHSQLYSAVREQTGRFTKSILIFLRTGAVDSPTGEAVGIEDPAAMADKRMLNLKLVEAIETEAKPARLIMLEIPDRHTGSSFSSYHPLPLDNDPYKRDGRHIEIVDELTAAAATGRKVYSEGGEGHLSPLGVAVAADKTVKILEAQPELQRYRLPPSR